MEEGGESQREVGTEGQRQTENVPILLYDILTGRYTEALRNT